MTDIDQRYIAEYDEGIERQQIELNQEKELAENLSYDICKVIQSLEDNCIDTESEVILENSSKSLIITIDLSNTEYDVLKDMIQEGTGGEYVRCKTYEAI